MINNCVVALVSTGFFWKVLNYFSGIINPNRGRPSPADNYHPRILLYFIRFVRKDLHLVFVITVLGVVISLGRTAIPYSTKYLVDTILVPGSVNFSLSGIKGIGHLLPPSLQELTFSLGGLVLLLALIGIIIGVLDICRRYASVLLRERFVTNLRTELYQHVLSFPMSFFRSYRSGEIVSRVSTDTAQVQAVALNYFPDTTSALFTVIFTILAMYSLSPMLLSIFLLILPPIGVVSYLISKRIKVLSYIEFEQLARIFNRIGETITGIDLVKGHAAERREAELLATDIRSLASTRVSNAVVNIGSEYIIMGLQGLVFLIVIYTGGNLVIHGEIRPGDFLAFVALIPFMTSSLTVLINVPSDLQRVLAAAGRIHELFQLESERPPQQSVNGPVADPPIHGDILFNNVSFTYPGGKKVFDHVSLFLSHGQIGIILGETGSGKTTLVQLLLKFYLPDDGTISIDGRDISTIHHEWLRTNIAFVSQDLFLFHDTIGRNIMYGKPEATMDEVIAAAKAAQIHEEIMKLPDGYDTVTGERGTKLSAGQRQRISLARAFIKGSPIIIMDEPTSSIDTGTEHRLGAILKTFSPPRTLLMVTHREALLDIADRIFIIHNGSLREVDHGVLIRGNTSFERLYD
ncbi:MAG: ABC transporter ATP-binding protein [Methanomicrobiales archaeon]